MKRIQLLALAGLLFAASCTEDNDPIFTDDREAFEGSWSCEETEVSASPVTLTFQINFSKKGSGDTVLISNFNNIGSSFSAVGVVSGTSLVIPNQDVGGFDVTEATGILANGKITLSYKVDAILYEAECTR